MRWFKRVLLGLAALVIVAVGGAYLLPRNVHVERSITIAAPVSTVFAIVNDLSRHKEFSPWEGIDQQMKMTITGPQGGVGQTSTWESENPNVGNGSQEIVESVPDRKVATALDFGEMGTASAAFLLDPRGAETGVTWTLDTDLGMNPIARYFGLGMDGIIGKDYEKGLAALKAAAEKGS